MSNMIRGKVIKFRDNINTDIISPPQYMEYSIEDCAKYAMSALDPDFYKKASQQTVMVAGKNFGSGSSRETAPLTLKYLGTEVIVAEFFARIFYRNAINIGLPVIECQDVGRIDENDELEVRFEEGKINNLTKNEEYACSKMPANILELIKMGGLVPFLKKKFEKA